MKTPLVTFFADIENRTYYSDHAKRFVKNCKDLNMPFIVRELQNKGDYRMNCLSKPKFLYEMIKEINVPFVWMDVDSIMHKQLTVFDDLAPNCDIGLAFTKLPNNGDKSISLPKASPIFINNTSAAIQFLWEWVQAANEAKVKNTPVFDHEILASLFVHNISKLRFGCLPPSYCIWPGENIDGEKHITMGIADGTSKEETLKRMGFDDWAIKYQTVGNKFVEMQ
jgi:hypothetical protein